MAKIYSLVVNAAIPVAVMINLTSKCFDLINRNVLSGRLWLAYAEELAIRIRISLS